jgi:integrative and conjugative element protein (TIGR02256 family)
MGISNPDTRLWVANSVVSMMLEFADQYYPFETGGMLLGYEASNGEVVVTHLIGPGPKARHSRFRFTPDSEYQQAELEGYFQKTSGRETYLGDWHTHPHSNSNLSWVDKKTLARIARTPESRMENPIMAVLGGGSGTWQLGAVRFLDVKRRLLFDDYRLGSLSLETF